MWFRSSSEFNRRESVDDSPEPRTDPVFVLGLMRSGTTFVQRLLNCHPELTIWGEHGGALQPLLAELQPVVFDAHHRQRIAQGFKSRDSVIGTIDDAEAFDPYVSPVPPEAYETLVDDVIRAQLVELFSRGLPAGTRWGFKETRYAGTVFRSLGRVFPAAQFVFVTRSVEPWMSSVVRAPFRDDLRPEQLDDADAVEDALESLLRLWTQRTTASLSFIEDDPERRLLISQEGLRTTEAAATIADRLGMGPLPDPPLSRVLSSRAGSSDVSTEWSGLSRTRLESSITAAVAGNRQVGELEARIKALRLV